jgi:hypothetical protein
MGEAGTGRSWNCRGNKGEARGQKDSSTMINMNDVWKG